MSTQGFLSVSLPGKEAEVVLVVVLEATILV